MIFAIMTNLMLIPVVDAPGFYGEVYTTIYIARDLVDQSSVGTVIKAYGDLVRTAKGRD